MEIREVLYVRKVAEHKNLTRAAEALHISQPSLSQSIKAIEDRLGVQLFVRSKRGVELTDMGERFLRDSAALTYQYDLFLSKLNHYKTSPNSIYLGLYKLFHTTPVNDAVMAYIANNSQENVILKVESMSDLEKMVESGHLDMAVVKYSPLQEKKPGLFYEFLFEEKLLVLVSQKNPLGNQDKVSVKDLVGNKLITSAKEEYPYAMIRKMLDEAGLELDIQTYTNYSNMMLIMNLVENDLGVTFATREVCQYYRREGIRYMPIDVDIDYKYFIIYSKKREQTKSIQALASYIKEATNKKGSGQVGLADTGESN